MDAANAPILLILLPYANYARREFATFRVLVSCTYLRKRAAFDGLRADQVKNRAQLYLDIPSGPFYGFNRPGAAVSQGLVQSWFQQGMQGGHKNTFDSIAAFSETDFRGDLTKFDKPTLVIHGTDDQVVPINVGGRASARMIRGATLVEYEGAPHGLTDTHKDRVNAALLAFARGEALP